MGGGGGGKRRGSNGGDSGSCDDGLAEHVVWLLISGRPEWRSLHCQSIAVQGAFKTGPAKSCFINDMVKKHFPVTKPVTPAANRPARTKCACCSAAVHRPGTGRLGGCR